MVYHATRSPIDFAEFVTGTQYIGDDYEDRELVIQGSGDPGAYIGPHFTGDAQLASRFAEGRAASWDQKRIVSERYVSNPAWPRVIPVYLRIENPIYFDSDEEMIAFIYEHGYSHELEDIIEAHGGFDDVDDDCYAILDEECLTKVDAYTRALSMAHGFDEPDAVERAAEELGSDIRALLQRRGHDGIIYDNTIEGGGLSFVPFAPWQIKSALANVGTWSVASANIME